MSGRQYKVKKILVNQRTEIIIPKSDFSMAFCPGIFSFDVLGLLQPISKANAEFSENLLQKSSTTISIIVQRDATQIALFIILQVHSTCFGCQPHS